MTKPPRTPDDPKSLIAEAFRIDGITLPECRSIFLDWALSVESSDLPATIGRLLTRHAEAPADHPMLAVLREGQAAPPAKGRRGGRRARLSED